MLIFTGTTVRGWGWTLYIDSRVDRFIALITALVRWQWQHCTVLSGLAVATTVTATSVGTTISASALSESSFSMKGMYSFRLVSPFSYAWLIRGYSDKGQGVLC